MLPVAFSLSSFLIHSLEVKNLKSMFPNVRLRPGLRRLGPSLLLLLALFSLGVDKTTKFLPKWPFVMSHRAQIPHGYLPQISLICPASLCWSGFGALPCLFLIDCLFFPSFFQKIRKKVANPRLNFPLGDVRRAKQGATENPINRP